MAEVVDKEDALHAAEGHATHVKRVKVEALKRLGVRLLPDLKEKELSCVHAYT